MEVWILRTVPKRIVELEMKTGSREQYHPLCIRPIFCDLRNTSNILGNFREKWKIRLNIFGHPTNSANWALSTKLIFGNQLRSAKRASLIPSGKIKHCWTSSKIRLIRPASSTVKAYAEYLLKYELSGKTNFVEGFNIWKSDWFDK